MKKAIFIDKDGTLTENVPDNINPARVQFHKGAIEGLAVLQSAGFSLVIVSNQSGIARGVFSELDLKNLWQYLSNKLIEESILIDGFFYCPHDLENCHCKKPKPGLFFEAARKLDINLAGSWMIGDILNDIEAGKRANCQTILISSGNETEWKITDERIPDFVAADLAEAARIIVTAEQQNRGEDIYYVT